jgi:hypothetical protein
MTSWHRCRRSVARFAGTRWARNADYVALANAVVAWVLARSGVDMITIEMPERGRAPGWGAGMIVAERERQCEEEALATEALLPVASGE